MQTFLPYSDFDACAQVLDNKRLGKQRVETLQIVKALLGQTKGWVNHPATKMWAGYERALLDYQSAVCHEWKLRGYKDTCLEKTRDLFANTPLTYRLPAWLGDQRLHTSHQSNLIRKDPKHYQSLFPDVADDLEYFWPSKQPEYPDDKALA